ncbi:hypothetical protein P4H71_20185 [Paenibacillus kribbensis]|uniref:hypothetical protein n=1 Tax=Paenibacillus kribbensis TaxID=172713 RepID=UPI002DB6F755|nr:hypothetical protein [Paenibacillus kribbensis]MEC0236641.1 hypothetical protein [Paenibacillus kribbensis]
MQNEGKDYVEYKMPTLIHELSGASAIFTEAVTSKTADAWKKATYTDSMNEATINLQNYCYISWSYSFGFRMVDFNDLDARDETADQRSNGNFVLTENYSSSPLVE